MARSKMVMRNGIMVPEEHTERPDTSVVELNAAGKLRRAGKGRRSLMDYFSEDKKLKAVTRSELLGIWEAVEHARLENRWYRKLWRWLTRTPGPQDMPVFMAKAHVRRTVKPMVDAVKAKLDADTDRAALASLGRVDGDERTDEEHRVDA